MTSLTSWFAKRFAVCNQGSPVWSHFKCISPHQQFLPRPPTAARNMTFWLARWEVTLLFLGTNTSQAGRERRFELGRGGVHVISGPHMKVRRIYLFRAWFIKRQCEQWVTIILSVVLYGCETWSLTLKEERRVKVIFFGVLLTVHLSIFILVINQLDAQNLFYNKFISCLYMFRAPYGHRHEVKILLYSPWYHHTYMSTWCSKHVEVWNKLIVKQILCIKLVNY